MQPRGPGTLLGLSSVHQCPPPVPGPAPRPLQHLSRIFIHRISYSPLYQHCGLTHNAWTQVRLLVVGSLEVLLVDLNRFVAVLEQEQGWIFLAALSPGEIPHEQLFRQGLYCVEALLRSGLSAGPRPFPGLLPVRFLAGGALLYLFPPFPPAFPFRFTADVQGFAIDPFRLKIRSGGARMDEP